MLWRALASHGHQIYDGCLLCRIRIFVRFYELFAADPVLGCLLDYSDADVPRDPKVHGRRFGLWLLARFPCQITNLCRHNGTLSLPRMMTQEACNHTQNAARRHYLTFTLMLHTHTHTHVCVSSLQAWRRWHIHEGARRTHFRQSG
jgi:hypothetical protein